MGPRVPMVMISRWAKPHYVSHVVRDHTSISRFIELLFDLPALTARDANADAMLDMFDFSCAQPATPGDGCTRVGQRRLRQSADALVYCVRQLVNLVRGDFEPIFC